MPLNLAILWTEELIQQWNDAHPVGSRFICDYYPDLVLTSLAPAFRFGNEGAVECAIPGQPLGGGMQLEKLACIDKVKPWSSST